MLVFKGGESLTSLTPYIPPVADELIGMVDDEMAMCAGGSGAATISNTVLPPASAPPYAEIAAEDAGIVERARAEAARIVAEAQSRVAEIEAVAREKAKAEAAASVPAEVEKAVQPIRSQLAASIDEISSLREQMTATVEREVVHLALEIARKVVRREVTVDREIVISLARVALARTQKHSVATVRLNPEDYQYVKAHREKLGSPNTIKLEEDPSISRGGCVVETDLGEVDARIEQQFEKIERGFLDEMEGE